MPFNIGGSVNKQIEQEINSINGRISMLDYLLRIIVAQDGASSIRRFLNNSSNAEKVMFREGRNYSPEFISEAIKQLNSIRKNLEHVASEWEKNDEENLKLREEKQT